MTNKTLEIVSHNNPLNYVDSNDVKERMLSFVKDIELSTFKYLSAIKEVETKMEILSEDYRVKTGNSPIAHISSRIKTPDSIMDKMQRNKTIAYNMKDIEENILDIAGIRITCSFIDDIYDIVDMIKNNKEFEIIKEKNYVDNVKPSGYRSYHLIVKVPIHLTTGVEKVNVEIQIRTMAMDFWASLEHQIKYKYNGYIPEKVAKDLLECSNMAFEMDKKMLTLHNEVLNVNQELVVNI